MHPGKSFFFFNCLRLWFIVHKLIIIIIINNNHIYMLDVVFFHISCPSSLMMMMIHNAKKNISSMMMTFDIIHKKNHWSYVCVTGFSLFILYDDIYSVSVFLYRFIIIKIDCSNVMLIWFLSFTLVFDLILLHQIMIQCRVCTFIIIIIIITGRLLLFLMIINDEG